MASKFLYTILVVFCYATAVLCEVADNESNVEGKK